MGASSQPVVLVIDSDPVSLLGIAATLHARQHVVHCAQSREAALRAARQEDLDLIIADVDVDGASGIGIVAEIQSMPQRGDVPAMFLASSQMADVVSRRFGSGSAFFLRRPFEPQVLLDLVEKALWMPHLVRSHINRPHIPVGPTAPGLSSIQVRATV